MFPLAFDCASIHPHPLTWRGIRRPFRRVDFMSVQPGGRKTTELYGPPITPNPTIRSGLSEVSFECEYALHSISKPHLDSSFSSTMQGVCSPQVLAQNEHSREAKGLKDRASERRSVPMTDQSQGNTSIPAVESYSPEVIQPLNLNWPSGRQRKRQPSFCRCSVPGCGCLTWVVVQVRLYLDLPKPSPPERRSASISNLPRSRRHRL